jgi:hypothetical protein
MASQAHHTGISLSAVALSILSGADKFLSSNLEYMPSRSVKQ